MAGVQKRGIPGQVCRSRVLLGNKVLKNGIVGQVCRYRILRGKCAEAGYC